MELARIKYDLKLGAFALLSIRFVQGWIYWGGGSRRFIYAPEKLDPYATEWMANKMQSAMPGAIFGTGEALSYILQHFYILYPFIIIFSLIELFSGLALLLGCFTRFSAFVTVLLSVSLMFLFGWQGTTCMDEWTMAASNMAMGIALMLAGSPIYSIDAWLMSRYPKLAKRRWFPFMASGPLPMHAFVEAFSASMVFVIFFTLITYNYYRGAIFTPYHGGPIDPAKHHIALTNGELHKTGAITFEAYVNSGTPAIPAYVMQVDLKDHEGHVLLTWAGRALRALTLRDIQNRYAYNQFKTGPYGLVAPVGSFASIHLSPQQPLSLKPGKYEMTMDVIDGPHVALPLTLR